MNESKITVRYAKALFALAKEGNQAEAMKHDMETLGECIREIPELKYVIQSPVIKVSDKIRLFEASFKNSFSELSMSFISLVLQRRREEHLEGISRYFLSLMKKAGGIETAEVVTAIPLDEKLRKSILNFIAKKFNTQIDLHEDVDKSLIGGFILRVGDQQIDASISSKLEHIRKTLTNPNS